MDLERWQETSRRIPVLIRLALILPALALPIYWWFTYAGPYRWLAEAQQRLWKAYYPMLTGMVVLGVVLGTTLAILLLLARLFHRRPQE